MKVDRIEAVVVELMRLFRAENHATQRNRYYAVLWAAAGLVADELKWEQIAAVTSQSLQLVAEWARRYRKHGLTGETPKPPGRRPNRLTPHQRQELSKVLDSGPTLESARSVFFGRDIRQIIQEYFGVVYRLNRVCALLHRLSYSHLVPRPKHAEDNPKAWEE